MNEEIQAAIDAAMQKVSEAMLEESARIGALRYLVEQLFANAFISDQEGFDRMLSAMIEKTGHVPVIRGVIDQEALGRLQASTAAHLERFRLDVLLRIQQGRQ